MLFGTITGVDPWSFGASDAAAADLGIAPGEAVKLQQVASDQLAIAGIALTRVPCLHRHSAAAGTGAARSASVCGGRGR